MPPIGKVSDAVFLEKHALGWTDKQLAALCECSRQVVQRRRDRLGLMINYRPPKVLQCEVCGCDVPNWRAKCRKCTKHDRKAPVDGRWVLQDKDILDVFLLRASGKHVEEIAERYSASPVTIYQILRRQNWKHVEIPQELILRVRELRVIRRKVNTQTNTTEV